MSTADDDFRRVAARGDFSVYPVRGRVFLRWFPRGQDGNPLCGHLFPGATIAGVLSDAVAATRPPERSLEELVSEMLYEQGRQRAALRH
jgi:hypothetical protein